MVYVHTQWIFLRDGTEKDFGTEIPEGPPHDNFFLRNVLLSAVAVVSRSTGLT